MSGRESYGLGQGRRTFAGTRVRNGTRRSLLFRLLLLFARTASLYWEEHVAHLRQHCHNSKFVIFQEKLLKGLKCCNVLWVQRPRSCSPAASFANCVMTLYLLKVYLQTFLPIPTTQKFQILSCDTLVANERCVCVCIYIYSDTSANEDNSFRNHIR